MGAILQWVRGNRSYFGMTCPELFGGLFCFIYENKDYITCVLDSKTNFTVQLLLCIPI